MVGTQGPPSTPVLIMTMIIDEMVLLMMTIIIDEMLMLIVNKFFPMTSNMTHNLAAYKPWQIFWLNSVER